MHVTLSDLVCFSHLPWDGVFQRPHHLLVRAALDRRVFYVQEPTTGMPPAIDARTDRSGVIVVTPHLPDGLDTTVAEATLASLVDEFVAAEQIVTPVLWYYTPLALPWSAHLDASTVVYDCMDELSAFRLASPRIPLLERELMATADVVFTGGQSLFEAKRSFHPNVHSFPSAVDVAHFASARRDDVIDPPDQAGIPAPRIGWFGVIDERVDLELLDEVARRRPDWSLVLVGPVTKIDPSALPTRPNVHYLGPRPYEELPAYLGGWDVAIMPFARNEATAFISPTKTPEYLAGGRPVVSTSIRDVVRPYGRDGLVRIADDPSAFVAACEAAMLEDPAERVARADRYLAGRSWDRTWASMAGLVDRAAQQRSIAAARSVVDDDRPAVRSVVPEARPIPAGATSSPDGYASAVVIAATEATRLDGRATRRAAATDERPRSSGRSDR